MPLALIVIGLILIVSGLHGETKNLFELIKGDFTGQGNFFYWAVAILFVGLVGYIKPVRPVSDAFLVLIVVVLFLKKGTGFFDQLSSALASTSVATTSSISSLPPLAPFGGTFNGHGASANF